MPCLTWNMIPAAHPCWPWKGPLLEPECCAGDSSHGTGSTGRLAATASHGASLLREWWGDRIPGEGSADSTGQCQTRSSRAPRGLSRPVCSSIRSGKTPSSTAGRMCSPCCGDSPPSGDRHLASSIPRRAERAKPRAEPQSTCATAWTLCEPTGNLRSRRWSLLGTGRCLGLLGLSSLLSGTQRAQRQGAVGNTTHNPHPPGWALAVWGSPVPVEGMDRREHQGLGIVTSNYLHTCKEHGTSGLFHLLVPANPALQPAVCGAEI